VKKGEFDKEVTKIGSVDCACFAFVDSNKYSQYAFDIADVEKVFFDI